MMHSPRWLVLLLVACLPLLCSAQLQRGEVTIEYQLREGVYYALVDRAGWSAPRTVRLCAERELAALPTDHTLYDPQRARPAADLVFSPLKSYLKKGDTVYYSPAGAIYFINLDALMDERGKRLCETYHFFRVSDIRSLPKDPRKHRYYTVLLYGGMDYYADPDMMDYYAWPCHTSDFQHFFPDSQGLPLSGISFGRTEDGTRAGISNLKESRGEIKFIYHINKFGVKPNTSCRALEELFRQDIRRTQEYVMHVSTHTFSIDFVRATGESDADYKRKRYKSCGLLFSGAGHTLKGEVLPHKLNDGLLYAEEIAGLDMSSCTLMVLGACNTALGVVTQDGILGLQSAFKEAGAQTLLMTLWSVNDKATSEFMKRFYTYLFDGKTKHESLARARADLMNSADFSDPIYWAPFIMLD